MADIKLTVGVEYSPSLVNFQDAIGKIAKSVNSNPPKIKVQLDTNSARTELAKLQNQIKALGNQKIKIEAVTSNKNTGKDSAKDESTKKLTSDTTAYNKALKSVNDLLIQLNKNQERWSQAGSGTSSSAYNDYVKQISAAESLKSSLESGNLTGKQFNETLTQIKANASEAAKSINFAGEDTKALEKLTTGTKEYNDALTKISTLRTKIQTDLSNWTAAETGSSQQSYNILKQQVIELDNLEARIKSINSTKPEFAEQFSAIGQAAAAASEQIKQAGENSKAIEKIAVGTKEYSDALTKISTLRTKLQGNIDKWTAAESGQSKQDYQALKNQITELDNLEAKLKTSGASMAEFREQFSAINQAATTATENIKKAGDDTVLLSTNTKEYSDAMAKLSKTQLDIQSKLQNWTAAKNGKSSASYEQLEKASEACDDLKTKLESGKMRMTDFNDQLSKVGSSASVASTQIQQAGENTLSFGDRLSNVTKFAAQFVSATRIIYAAIRTFKDMARTSIEIESAMNRIQIVTGATNSQMENFFSEATSRAKELGTSITDIAGSIETFSRLGLT